MEKFKLSYTEVVKCFLWWPRRTPRIGTKNGTRQSDTDWTRSRTCPKDGPPAIGSGLGPFADLDPIVGFAKRRGLVVGVSVVLKWRVYLTIKIWMVSDHLIYDKLFCENLELIKGYFYSWREYKTILDRLKHVHGIKRSLTWLKTQLKKLGLKKRRPDADIETVKTVVRKLLRTSESLKGYSFIWKVLRDRYQIL